MARSHEVIIIGGGHNGLTVAGYLAKAGVDVPLNRLLPVSKWILARCGMV
ncbi:MAG: hypothetical protein JRF34_11605 [Deltaproteobacteria bacterium]|nr:hypothetical protein [Deltaproteobacteria bacterium]